MSNQQPDEAARAAIRAWIEETEDDDTAELPTSWPVEVWEVLVRDFPDLRYWAAHSRHAPEAIVRRLARDEDWRVRSRIAEKRSLPRDLFDVLVQDEDEAVRKRVATNAKTPLEILERLTHDALESVARVATYHLSERRAKQKK